MKILKSMLACSLLVGSSFVQAKVIDLNLHGIRTRGTWSDAAGKKGTYTSLITHKDVEGSPNKASITESTKVFDADGREIMDNSVDLEIVGTGNNMFKVLKDGVEVGDGYVINDSVHYNSTINNGKGSGSFEQTIILGRRAVLVVGSMSFTGEQSGKVIWSGHGRHR